jgi:hypothetical protein
MKAVSLPKLKKKAQLVFNEFIRLRDAGLPCISCNHFKPLQAGHYFAVSTHDGLRYDEKNCNGECAGCNCFNESHLIGYDINLIDKIGGDEYVALIFRAANYKKFGRKFSRGDVEEIIRVYTEKIKLLK